MSMDQIEGLEPLHENWGNITLGDEIDEGGDPPRVWAANGEEEEQEEEEGACVVCMCV
jgi:hypothetical protein